MPLLVSTIEQCNLGAKRQKSTQNGSESEYTEKRFSGYFQYAGVYFVYSVVEIAVNSGFCFQKSILKITLFDAQYTDVVNGSFSVCRSIFYYSSAYCREAVRLTQTERNSEYILRHQTRVSIAA